MKITVESGMRSLYPKYIAAVEALEDPKCTNVGEDKKSRQGGVVFETADDCDLNTALAKVKAGIRKDKSVQMSMFRVVPTEK